jgi:hypothetical protein
MSDISATDDDPFVPPHDLAFGISTNVRTESRSPVRTSVAFSQVYLLALGENGLTAIPDLRLELDESGVLLQKAQGDPVWQVGWSQVTALSTPERSELPNSARGVVLELTTTEPRTHRFVVPAGKPAAIEAALNSLATSKGVRTKDADQKVPALTALLVLGATSGVIALLLLAAGHVINL